MAVGIQFDRRLLRHARRGKMPGAHRLKGRRGDQVVKRLLTIADAAALLGVKPQTLYLWVSLRRIPHRKVGRLIRFTEGDLEEYVEKQKQLPTDGKDGGL